MINLNYKKKAKMLKISIGPYWDNNQGIMMLIKIQWKPEPKRNTHVQFKIKNFRWMKQLDKKMSKSSYLSDDEEDEFASITVYEHELQRAHRQIM